MWGADDYLGRWLHGICGVFLLPFGVLVEYYSWTHVGSFGDSSGRYALGIGAIYVGARCLWYAITGRNNINFDYLNNR
jgi:hypothetical protein